MTDKPLPAPAPVTDAAEVPVGGARREPEWTPETSDAAAWRGGLKVAFGVPGAVLFSTSLGFGALAHDSEVGIAMALFLTATIYALPAQVVLLDQLARGASLWGAAFVVTLTAVRLLPMTVSVVPYLTGRPGTGWRRVLAVHFMAITTWIEGTRRIPHLPAVIRLPFFIGIGCGMLVATMSGTAVGYVLAGSVPLIASAALLFMTPVYFLCSLIGNADRPAIIGAIAVGAGLEPVFYALAPGFDLLLSGLVGGTLAWWWGRGRG